MNERWIKDMQDRFTDFEKPAPEGLLADVQREMRRRCLAPVEQKQGRVIPLWVRGLAVAASVAVALGVGAFLLTDRHVEMTEIEGLTETMQTLQDIQKEAEMKENQDNLVSSATSAPVSPFSKSGIFVSAGSPAAVLEKQQGENEGQNEPDTLSDLYRIDDHIEQAEAEGQVSSDDNPTSDKELALTQPNNNPSAVQQSAGKIVRSQRSTVSNWQVGVNASGLRGLGNPSYSYLTYNNILSNSDKDFFQATVNKHSNVVNPEVTEHNHGHGDVAAGDIDTNTGKPIMDDPTPDNQQQPITDMPNESPVYYSPNFAYTRFQNNSMSLINDQPAQVYMTAHHRQPVKVGVSLRYQFNDRWGVQTGIDYSYHSSNLISQIDNSQIQSEQKLHLIGLPVAFSYSLWSPGKFNFYLSVGGEVEKVIKGSRTSLKLAPDKPDQIEKEDVEEKPWQISVVGSGGVQFNINHLLSLYAEPGVAYYFNNHSSLPTIYQEKPFNLNLNFGLRFNLNSE